MSAIRRIVYATDFSPASRPAFGRALDLARANRAELIALHVVTPPLLYGPEAYAMPQVYDGMVADLRAAARKQLDRLVARAKAAGVRARALVQEGIPHDRVVRAARSLQADLLVIGTHGRTGLARLFVGSVASRVIAAAACPVLSVRGAGGSGARPPGRRRARRDGGRG
jgi:nucleotide-binding universal stress UspA family protein